MEEPVAMAPGGKVDKKLAHLVKKMMNPNDSTPPNIDYVVTILRTQHREYQRKNASELKKQVEIAVAYLLGPPNQQQSPLPQLSSSKKRRAEDAQEKQYDAIAMAEEAVREKIGVGGGLNATLRQNYLQKQVQREERADPIATVKAEVVGASEKQPTKSTTDPTSSGTSVKMRKRGKTMPTPERDYSQAGSDVSFLQPVLRPKERYADLGGMDIVIRELRQLVEYPILRPELYRHLGIEPPRGVLLRGPPGTGKSHLANAVAGELGVSYFRVSAPELVSGMSGESEGRIRDLFKSASDLAPAIIFLDEIDAVAPKRNEGGSTRGMEKRMVAQLLTSMDAISPDQNRENAAVIVLAATNRPDSLDSALRRAGRFDREILLGVPDEDAREKIIRAMSSGMRLSGDFDFKLIAKKTPGFVGADLRSLTKEAAVLAINRIFQDVLQIKGKEEEKQEENVEAFTKPKSLSSEELAPLFVTMSDFLEAIRFVQPSSKREGFATVPDVSWDDIGALQEIREELAISVIEPIRNPEKFKSLGLTIHAGILLYGPPGCGKTLLAKAIANESGANFISVKGPELLDKYVGESERAVRVVFERARASSPCVVFFDELDSLVPKRGMDSGGSGVSERVVNQLLTELDGLESRRSVFVIAATNRPELIDPAMMRPGRLDKLLYVPVPTPRDRVSILKALAKDFKLASDVDLEMIGSSHKADGYSGADCSALLREAGLAVIKESSSTMTLENGSGKEKPLRIYGRHFEAAFKAVMPSVSKRDQKRYDRIRERICSARSRATEEVDNGQKDTVDDREEMVVTEEMDLEAHPAATPEAHPAATPDVVEENVGEKSSPKPVKTISTEDRNSTPIVLGATTEKGNISTMLSAVAGEGQDCVPVDSMSDAKGAPPFISDVKAAGEDKKVIPGISDATTEEDEKDNSTRAALDKKSSPSGVHECNNPTGTSNDTPEGNKDL